MIFKFGVFSVLLFLSGVFINLLTQKKKKKYSSILYCRSNENILVEMIISSSSFERVFFLKESLSYSQMKRELKKLSTNGRGSTQQKGLRKFLAHLTRWCASILTSQGTTLIEKWGKLFNKLVQEVMILPNTVLSTRDDSRASKISFTSRKFLFLGKKKIKQNFLAWSMVLIIDIKDVFTTINEIRKTENW